MSTILTPRQTSAAVNAYPERRAVARLLAQLDQLAEYSPHFVSKSRGQFESAGQTYSLPRYIYVGSKGGGDAIRIGIFATIHGDEPEGAQALTRFARELENNSEIAKGCAQFI